METMDTRRRLIEAALKVIERDGSAGFSTRAVCDIAHVRAPALYHHFGSADGLLSAAVAEAFEQFLHNKTAPIRSPDPVESLSEGWDDYVRFAAERPRLYATMMARVLSGARIASVDRSFAALAQDIREIAVAGRLAIPEDAAAQVAWASANAAAMLYVTTALQITEHLHAPDPAVLRGIRDRAIDAICLPPEAAQGASATRT